MFICIYLFFILLYLFVLCCCFLYVDQIFILSNQNSDLKQDTRPSKEKIICSPDGCVKCKSEQ